MTDRAPAFREWFGIDAAAARVLDELYAAGGRVVGYDVLRDLAGACNGITGNIRTRLEAWDRVIEPGSIRFATCRGAALTRKGLRDCDAALRDAVRREVAA